MSISNMLFPRRPLGSRPSAELVERYLYLTGELPRQDGTTILSRRILEIMVARAEDVQKGLLRK
jgi:hypothetical protein